MILEVPRQKTSLELVFCEETNTELFWAHDGLVRVTLGLDMHSKHKCARIWKGLGKEQVWDLFLAAKTN